MAEQRFFQFLAGERQGEVLVYDGVVEEDGMVFVCFKDGSRCNEELVLPINERNWSSQYMAEVESPSNCWTFKEEWVGQQKERQEPDADGKMQIVVPYIQGRKKVTPLPPRRTKSNFGELAKKPDPVNDKHAEDTKSAQTALNEEKKALLVDPVWLMMDKAKKFDTEVEMNLVISLPSRSLYNVAKESFDDGGEKVIEYIIHHLDDAKVRESLKMALKQSYGEEILPMAVTYKPDVVEEPIIAAPRMMEDPFVSAEENKK
jgi:hypothetical protein